MELVFEGWRKSSRSEGGASNCVELAHAVWRKSSRSQGGANNCVELAHVPGVVAVRDSKNPTGPVITFGVTELDGFLATVKSGRFDG